MGENLAESERDKVGLNSGENEVLELQIEQKWDELFAVSQDLLMEWAKEALEDYEAGQTIPLY